MSQESPKPAEPQTTMAQKQTSLATFRTQLSLDRTTLAWVRTTLTMASFGLGMVGFFRSLQQQHPTPASERLHAGAIRFGTLLIVIGIVATVIAAISHWFSLRRLIRGEPPILRQWPLSIVIAFLFALLSLGGLWAVLPH